MSSVEILSKSWEWQVLAMFAFFAGRALVLAGGSTLFIRFSTWARSRQIVPGRNSFRKLAYEAINGMKILLLDAVFSVSLVTLGVFRFLPLDGIGPLLVTFGIMFVWGEIYFYYTHVLFHKPQFFWIHKHHHQSALLNPWTSLSFSVAERLVLLVGLVLLPAIVSRWFPFPVEALLFYFFFNYVLNVYGHLNVEITSPSFVRSGAGKVVNTTTYHTLHHMRYRGHYGLFTSILDKIHGTKFQDYELLQEANYKKGVAAHCDRSATIKRCTKNPRGVGRKATNPAGFSISS